MGDARASRGASVGRKPNGDTRDPAAILTAVHTEDVAHGTRTPRRGARARGTHGARLAAAAQHRTRAAPLATPWSAVAVIPAAAHDTPRAGRAAATPRRRRPTLTSGELAMHARMNATR